MNAEQASGEAIRLVPYEAAWPEAYAIERDRLASLFTRQLRAIEHVGSTAVPGMLAKPIVDILAGVDSMAAADDLFELVLENGYTTSRAFNEMLPDRRWFMRSSGGRRTHHLHLVVFGSPTWHRHLLFRDRLRADAALAQSYARLKRELAARFEHDREAYTDAKSEFVATALGLVTDDSLSPMQAYYAARAGEYDAVYEKPERQADLREIERWLPSVLGGRRLLEIACGTGYWTRFLAPVASSILAIDSARETLEIARRRVPNDKVTFVLGDAYAPTRQAGPFTAAFAGFWFSHVPHERQVEFLISLNAALEPGAKVVFLDNRFVAGSSTAISEPDEHGDTYQARRLGDGSTHRVLKNFPSEAQLHALVAASRGRSARYVAWPHFWAFEYQVPGA